MTARGLIVVIAILLVVVIAILLIVVIAILRVFLSRVLESNFPGDPVCALSARCRAAACIGVATVIDYDYDLGGTSCLTLLVYHVPSSKAAKNVADYGDP